MGCESLVRRAGKYCTCVAVRETRGIAGGNEEMRRGEGIVDEGEWHDMVKRRRKKRGGGWYRIIAI